MANPLFQNYQNERQMQDRAASMLPQLDQANAENQIRAGQMGEGYDRENMMADREKWEEERLGPLRGLRDTYGIASDMGGRFGTQTQTSKTSDPWGMGLGLGMMGLGGLSGLSGMFGGGGGMGNIGGGGGGFMGMMGGGQQYGFNNWRNAGGSSFNNRGGFASPSQRY
jgi:hypothetical protein